MAVTLKQIAQHTGLSIPTVHQILNNYDAPFAEATRKKVLAAAAELNYVPDMAARSLVQRRSFLLGVLFNGVNFALVTPFMRGVQSALRDRGYAPVFLTHSDLDEELANLKLVTDRRVDGLILNAAVGADGETNSKQLAAPRSQGTPSVEVFGRFIPAIPHISFDFEAAGKLAVRQLREAGHERLAILARRGFNKPGATSPFWSARDLVKGFSAAQLEVGVEEGIIIEYEVESDLTRPDGGYKGAYLAAERLLSHPERPTGVVCYSPRIAEAVALYCEHHRAKVPEGFTLTAFGQMQPLMSTVARVLNLPEPSEEVGRRAVRMLFDQAGGKKVRSAMLSPDATSREREIPSES